MEAQTPRAMEFIPTYRRGRLRVRRFSGSEQLGADFEYVITLYSDDYNIPLELEDVGW
jgi:uncharacterized protein involved in type VI secretion and phage assembly